MSRANVTAPVVGPFLLQVVSANTVQDHLKAVFVKVGVRSRRELVVQILRDHYSPHLKAGHPAGPSGFFA
jgi:hypothetical protein